MSNMENLAVQLDDKARQSEVYQAARAEIEAHNTRHKARGYAVMAAALGYGEGAIGNGIFSKVSHAAKLFCIGFAFLVPSLLIWRVLL